MLIYNFQKEFIGIDEADLEIFGFTNLSELKAEASDFADLFVRTPGYIHNFKHVHWIDFITCSEASEESKVIIEVNAKTYKANIAIDTMYLSDNPTAKAYLVTLNNLKSLTVKENGEIAEDIARKRPPRIEPTVGHAFNLPDEGEDKVATEATPELEGFKPFENLQETPAAEVVEYMQEVQEPSQTAPLDISFDNDDIHESIFDKSKEEPLEVETPTVEVKDNYSIDPFSLDLDDLESEEEETHAVVEQDDGFDYSYNYDPQVASDELGLPIDLIEEFIQDFIAQAKEFKDELFASADAGDTNNVQILSHKLKGVAANLRIEDAFNTLSIINTSSDVAEIESHLRIFYKIIAKLSGEEIQGTTVAESKPIEATQETKDEGDLYDDDLIIGFKDDEIEESSEQDEVAIVEEPEEIDIDTTVDEENNADKDDDLYLDFDVDVNDSEVPQKIEMPELADDEFLNDKSKEDLTDDIDVSDLLSIDEEEDKTVSEAQETLEIEDNFIIENDFEPEEEILDIQYSKMIVANEIGLDQESFDEIFNDYITDSRLIVSSINDAIAENDYATCKQEAIKLKGMSENMRVNAFNDQLNSLMNSSDEDELTQATKKIDAVIAQISQ